MLPSSSGFLAWLILRTLRMEATDFSETSVDFGLHDVISEKIELFISSFSDTPQLP
jgi:hypothetical protein